MAETAAAVVRPKVIYKVLTKEQGEELERDGEFKGAPIDVSDGFIHLSAAPELAKTVELYFAGQEGLVLVAVSTEACGADLRWELSPKRGTEFPHLYNRPLNGKSDVLWSKPLDRDDLPTE